MDEEDVLNAILQWFRDTGGEIGDSDEIPIEVRLKDALFYVGVISSDEPVVELSALVYLGMESTESEEAQIEDIASEISNETPTRFALETTFSVGTDVWVSVSLSSVDFTDGVPTELLRCFTDYAFTTTELIQRKLHPLDVVLPLPGSSAMAALRDLVGVEELVAKAEELASLVRVAELRKRENLHTDVAPPHLVFTGNPGTGKTTVARLIGTLFREIGLLPSGHLVEARRSDLVGKFVGQTTPKTEAVINAALGGVLFVDEAYSLVEGYNNSRSFGEECIATLLLAMENLRGKFVLIVAGYPEEMNQFMNSNPGLQSRFDQKWYFRDYTNDELVTIVSRYALRNDYVMTPECKEKVFKVFASATRDKHFGNARVARELFHSMKRLHAVRVLRQGLVSKQDLMTIGADDVQLFSRDRVRPPIGFSAN